MDLTIIDETKKVDQAIIEQTEKLLKFAATFIKLPESKEMNVTFVDNARIQEINKEYRGKDMPTDVVSLEYEPMDISFDDFEDMPTELMDELDPFIGEIFISTQQAKEQAQDYGHSYEREIGFLSVHGFLHINGYDHMNPTDEKEMFDLQDDILNAYGLTRK
ncbi:MAG: rRNA maturation RNase YbeY [Streptococcaceae bacterium]|jgi:probable rRNA maturation factor|nr:rRNA maturation RNase YbeY [Streptococcaceae bacterium]